MVLMNDSLPLGMHAVRSKQDLPAMPAELTSELLHCLSTLPDPWPMTKVTPNMDTVSQWGKSRHRGEVGRASLLSC